MCSMQLSIGHRVRWAAWRTSVPSSLWKKFTGFVFKIQANMDPKHRDRIAFMRICSGKYEKA